MVLAFNLLVTYALLRRVRHSETRNRVEEPPLPELGRPVPRARVRTTEGADVDLVPSSGSALLVFLSTSCPSCQTLAAQVRNNTVGPLLPDTSFLVSGPADDTMFSDLRNRRVIRLDDNTDSLDGLGDVAAFPTIIVATDGVIAGASYRMRELQGLVSAAG